MATEEEDKDLDVPRDAKVIALILQSMGVQDCEPRVIEQLIEFIHRYTTDIFQDALIYAEHAQKQDIDLDDVKLSIQGKLNHSFTTPPPKEFMLELAQQRNSVRLPVVPEKFGVRLPPERHCLTGVNYQIIPERLSVKTAPSKQIVESIKPFKPPAPPTTSSPTNNSLSKSANEITPKTSEDPMEIDSSGFKKEKDFSIQSKARGEDDDYDF